MTKMKKEKKKKKKGGRTKKKNEDPSELKIPPAGKPNDELSIGATL